MRASPSPSQLWQPHSRLCQLCSVCEQQRSFTPGFRRKELHATEGAVQVRRAWRRLEDTVTDERALAAQRHYSATLFSGLAGFATFRAWEPVMFMFM